MDTREQLKTGVEREYLLFRDEQITKPSDVVFDESYKNLFYIELYTFFQSDENGLSNGTVNILAADTPHLLSKMWDFSITQDDFMFLTWLDISNHIDDYIEVQTKQDMMS